MVGSVGEARATTVDAAPVASVPAASRPAITSALSFRHDGSRAR